MNEQNTHIYPPFTIQKKHDRIRFRFNKKRYKILNSATFSASWTEWYESVMSHIMRRDKINNNCVDDVNQSEMPHITALDETDHINHEILTDYTDIGIYFLNEFHKVCDEVAEELPMIFNSKFKRTYKCDKIYKTYCKYSQNSNFNNFLVSGSMLYSLLKGNWHINTDADDTNNSNKIASPKIFTVRRLNINAPKNGHKKGKYAKKPRYAAPEIALYCEDRNNASENATNQNHKNEEDAGYSIYKVHNQKSKNNSEECTYINLFLDHPTLPTDIEAFIRVINQVIFCVFINSLKDWIKEYNKPDKAIITRLINKYKPLLLFHVLTVGYKWAVNHALTVGMYTNETISRKNNSTSLDISNTESLFKTLLGESFFNVLLDNPVCYGKANMSKIDYSKQKSAWWFKPEKISRENKLRNKQFFTIYNCQKINLYKFCCDILADDEEKFSREHCDAALVLYNSAIRTYCFDPIICFYKMDNDIYSKYEESITDDDIEPYSSMWYLLDYNFFEYSSFIPKNTTSKTRDSSVWFIQSHYELLSRIQKWRSTILNSEKSETDKFVSNCTAYIEKSAESYRLNGFENDMYNFFINYINAQLRNTVLTLLMKDCIDKIQSYSCAKNKLCPSTTDFKQTPPDNSKESLPK